MMFLFDKTPKKIVFRGVELLIGTSSFERFRSLREERINGGTTEMFKDGHGVRDYFAERGEFLVEGGEVCPIEMGIFVGPMNEGNTMLEDMFGKEWHTYKDWK